MNIYFKETNYGTFCLLEKDLISNCIENYPESEQDQKVIKLLKEWGYNNYRLDIGYKEDCILVYPDKHKYEIEFIEKQQYIKWIK